MLYFKLINLLPSRKAYTGRNPAQYDFEGMLIRPLDVLLVMSPGDAELQIKRYFWSLALKLMLIFSSQLTNPQDSTRGNQSRLGLPNKTVDDCFLPEAGMNKWNT